MIFDTDTDCAHIIVTAAGSPSFRLLTDQQTALDMRLPYAMLGNGMALVWTGPRAEPRPLGLLSSRRRAGWSCPSQG